MGEVITCSPNLISDNFLVLLEFFN
jgi:hypothetical protein